MLLKEAKEILKENGFILEDTETGDDYQEELRTKLYKTPGPGNGILAKMYKNYQQHMDLDAKIVNAKKFNAVNEDKKDIIEAFKAIKAMAGKGGWEFEEDSNPDDFFTLKELTDGTLERVIKQNKGFYTIIIDIRKTLNKFNDFVEIELLITPHGNTEIQVNTNDKNKKRFDVTEYKTAIKYANGIH